MAKKIRYGIFALSMVVLFLSLSTLVYEILDNVHDINGADAGKVFISAGGTIIGLILANIAWHFSGESHKRV